MAIIILPQLGSSPAIAVFTRDEFAIENAIYFASLSVLQLSIFFSICNHDIFDKLVIIFLNHTYFKHLPWRIAVMC